MLEFKVQREIAASPSAVWAQLTDAQALVAGGLGVTRLEGRIGSGEHLKVWSEIAPERAFPVRVAEFDPPRRMVWEGGMPFGLFKGRRLFTLMPFGAGTRFEMSERFTGLLAGVIGRSMPDLTPSFERFADGLKRLAEGDAR